MKAGSKCDDPCTAPGGGQHSLALKRSLLKFIFRHIHESGNLGSKVNKMLTWIDDDRFKSFKESSSRSLISALRVTSRSPTQQRQCFCSQTQVSHGACEQEWGCLMLTLSQKQWYFVTKSGNSRMSKTLFSWAHFSYGCPIYSTFLL